MADTIEQLLARWRGSWLLLAQASIWLLGILTGFLLPPPVGAETESQIWVRFAQFVVTVIVGLILLAALRWQRKKHTLRWAGCSALTLLLATATFFGYQLCVASWTADYDGIRVVVGADLTSFGQRWREEHPEQTPEQIVKDLAGKVTKFWTRESVERRRLALATLYVLAMPLFTVCVIATVQAIRCASPDKPSHRRSRARKVKPAPPQPTSNG